MMVEDVQEVPATKRIRREATEDRSRSTDESAPMDIGDDEHAEFVPMDLRITKRKRSEDENDGCLTPMTKMVKTDPDDDDSRMEIDNDDDDDSMDIDNDEKDDNGDLMEVEEIIQGISSMHLEDRELDEIIKGVASMLLGDREFYFEEMDLSD